MSYNKRIYSLAQTELEKRQRKATSSQRKRHEEALLKIPELEKIEKEISSAGLDVVRAIGMGENAQDYIDSLANKNLEMQEKRRILLAKAGYPEDYLKTRYTCDKCRDTGYVGGWRCDCYSALVKKLAYSELCSDSPLETSTFEKFNLGYYPKEVDEQTGVSPQKRMSEILNFCKSYAGDFGTDSPSLFMYGATGLGKTHLSLAIAGKAIEAGFGVIYGSAQNILLKLERERFSRFNAENGESEQTLLGCDLLVLDDLGAEFSTSFTVSVIYNIINTRLLRCLPTIISTNLNPEELEEKYTQRITSRIIGNYISLLFCGKDIRQIK
ncbi:MAG TPA: ATP-binding protein [Clostridia bacterium]|nr:ATP-binding protein [Clostridia bacterium]